MYKETIMEVKKINNKLSRAQKKNKLPSDVQRKNLSLSKKIKEVRKENDNIFLALIKKDKKLSKLNPRIINKRLKARVNNTIKQMSAKETSLQPSVILEESCQKLNKNQAALKKKN